MVVDSSCKSASTKVDQSLVNSTLTLLILNTKDQKRDAFDKVEFVSEFFQECVAC